MVRADEAEREATTTILSFGVCGEAARDARFSAPYELLASGRVRAAIAPVDSFGVLPRLTDASHIHFVCFPELVRNGCNTRHEYLYRSPA